MPVIGIVVAAEPVLMAATVLISGDRVALASLVALTVAPQPDIYPPPYR